MLSKPNPDPINGAALVDELREVFGCIVSLTPRGQVSLVFPAGRLVDVWMKFFIKAHLGELRAALVDEQQKQGSSFLEREEASL